MSLDPDRFCWCDLCQTVAYILPCCANTTCNGGGCDLCEDLWMEATEAIKSGNHPPRDQLEVLPLPWQNL